jgi:hypothetical protein
MATPKLCHRPSIRFWNCYPTQASNLSWIDGSVTQFDVICRVSIGIQSM